MKHNISEQSRKIIKKSDKLSVPELSDKYGVSRQRIRQILTRAGKTALVGYNRTEKAKDRDSRRKKLKGILEVDPSISYPKLAEILGCCIATVRSDLVSLGINRSAVYTSQITLETASSRYSRARFRKVLHKKQKGLCAICKRNVTLKRTKDALFACVDHCHDSNRIRAVLCAPCNQGLGQFADNPEYLRRAADYVEAHRNTMSV